MLIPTLSLKDASHEQYLQKLFCVVSFLITTVIIVVTVVLTSFSHRFSMVIFHWSLSDSKSTKSSRTLLTDRKSSEFQSFHSFSRFFRIIPKYPTIINFFLFNSFESFSHQRKLMVFRWSLCDSKSSQVSRTLLSILVNLKSSVIWMFFTRVLISNSSRSFTDPLVSVSSAPIIIGITVTFMSHCFFSFLARFRYLSLFSPSFNFTQWSAGTEKSTIRQVLWGVPFLFFFFFYYH